MAGDSTITTEEDWQIARRGLSLFLNNKPEEAEILFALRSNSFHIKTVRCFVLFMNALMTFEDEEIAVALEMLKNTERECENDVGWLKSMMNKVFGGGGSSEMTLSLSSEYARRLERQIVLADTKVCSAMLTLLQREAGGYLWGGWMMRKAWRIYQHTYSQVLQLYRRTFGRNPSGLNGTTMVMENSTIPDPCCVSLVTQQHNQGVTSSSSSPSVGNPKISSSSSLQTSISMLFSLTSTVVASSSTDQPTTFVEPAEVVRLMSAVSFGYGIFQLCVSLVPPSMLKFINLLGFEGDRKAGLAALMYARLSQDLRAPLATLSLLCYHTIVGPFYSLHDWSVNSGVDAAKQLIAESRIEFNDAALFLFFTGRTERLQSNIEAALEAYGKVDEASTHREIKLICLHDVAWCHLIRLNYRQAHVSFSRLQRESRWSESINAYLIAVCAGADNNTSSILRIHQELTVTLGSESKLTKLDRFVLRRVSKLTDENGRVYCCLYYKLLVYELLYLWNALPSSSSESLDAVIAECKECGRRKCDEPMSGLADLIAGAAYSYRGEKIAAMKSYRNCLERRKDVIGTSENNDDPRNLQDRHVSAFALYELGIILCATNRTEEGRCALNSAQNEYTDYDFQNRLTVRIHSALKALNP